MVFKSTMKISTDIWASPHPHPPERNQDRLDLHQAGGQMHSHSQSVTPTKAEVRTLQIAEDPGEVRMELSSQIINKL